MILLKSLGALLCVATLCTAVNVAHAQQTPEQVFNQAVAAQQQGDRGVAYRLYSGLLAQYPTNLAVRVNFGALLVDMGRLDEAIADYLAGLQAQPGNRDLHLALNAAREDKGDAVSLLAASDDLEKLHLADPADKTVTMLLGDVLNRRERYAAAMALLMPLEQQAAGYDDLEYMLGTAMVHAGKQDDGAELLEAVAKRSGRADAWLLAGQTRLSASQFDLARRDADAAVSKEPALAGGETLRGMVLVNLGSYPEAKVALVKALKANPDDFNAAYSLGALLYFERDLTGATAELEKALELAPQSVEARYKLALVEQKAGETGKALSNLEAVTRQRPEWLEPHAKLAALYFSLNRSADGTRETSVVNSLMSAQRQRAAP